MEEEIFDKLKIIKDILESKKGEDIVIIDMRRFYHISDFFVLCTYQSDAQMKAMVDEIWLKFKKMGKRVFIEGYPNSKWIVLVVDGDIIVHLFDDFSRRFYDIESLWSDAERINL